MALMKISEYQLRFSKGSRPDARTIKKWIESGSVYGEKIGAHYYIDPDRTPTPAQRIAVARHPLVRAVLAKAARDI